MPVHDAAEDWPVVDSVDLHRDDWVMALRADTVHPPGRPTETFRRLVLEHPGAVVVLALDESERVFVLQQYRHPARRRFVELPAGLLDGADEDPLDVAVRELREEAELQAARWEPLLTTWASPGISAEQHHYFLATGLSHAPRGDFELHAEEADLRPEWVQLSELRDAILAGEVQDAPTVLAVLALDARRRRAAE